MSVGGSAPERLRGCFLRGLRRAEIPRLRHLKQSTPRAAAHHALSLRPQHTVGPLAALLGITPNVDFVVGREADLVGAAKATLGAVLIAWHHEAIPAIANSIIGNETTCPQHWPGERFDMLWVFDRQAGASWRFSQVPQLLLAGDTAHPIA